MVEQKMRGKGKAVGRGGTFSAGTHHFCSSFVLTFPFTQSILSFSF
jgi:hypothetical protein